MKRLIMSLAMAAAASGPSLAGETPVKQSPAVDSSQAATPRRPLLDRMKTFSIYRDAETAGHGTAEPRVRSGIEVNPWIVPSFH